MRYFDLIWATEGESADRWKLMMSELYPDGSPVDVWAYTRCKVINNARPVPLFVKVPGRSVDYDLLTFGAPVVSRRMGDLIESLAAHDVQRIPAIVDAPGDWEVLNVLACVDCIDHKRSKITYYPDDHPEKAGKPRGVFRLVVDGDRIRPHHICRPKDWKVAIIISEELKNLLADKGITGCQFDLVTRDY